MSMTTSIFRKIRRKNMEQKSDRFINIDTSLHNLISKQEWDEVDHLLAETYKSKHSLPIKKSLSSTVATATDDLILHHACQYNAPLQTIIKLSMIFPSSKNTHDDRGRYPIHVAVASGCMPYVIRFFIQANPTYAGLQDYSGKTPMHYAGESYAKTFIENYFDFPGIYEVHKNTLHVVKLLVEAAPQTVNIEDVDEMNPIEYALINATNIKVVKLMQRASRGDWRTRKTEEHKSHEDLAKGVQCRSSPTAEGPQCRSSHLTIKFVFSRRRLWASTA
mmetsp:Transcript_30999/g.65472  ORF Transcript_30999/g.65472 Transcript_30999/m.65472 type:complete len:276 (-) Transcript_30999:100-927(-)|eukprot:CAMPEP_0172315858 /NCGR_PEP_ID=MMETSP1058-20130122/26514_1 /TAXON_ID=83371 /ORGANISM="Detonula confervacea, Strain CCMP 353" /LENGTH=275 /DNA_ID=CAMNT_0013030035 /DNA_START=192 /DNA_END=1019 /DNA_ORIENTATION=+